jgi:hypothetical protein
MRRVGGMAKVRTVAWNMDRSVMNEIKRLTKGDMGTGPILVISIS